MLSRLAADAVVLLHLAFVLFALFGGLLVLRSRRWLALHLPALAWAAAVELAGWPCPLTPLENLCRLRAGGQDYDTGFIEHYLLPLLYPADLTRPVQIALGLGVIAANLVVYGWVCRRELGRLSLAELGTAPNLVSLARLALVPAMLAAAWHSAKPLFLLLFALALATDAVDGWLARRLGQRSELGARLDSWGDSAVYLATPLAIWWLWPALVQEQAPWVAAGLAAFILPILLGLARFGRLTSYHTRGAKLAAVLLGLAIPIWLLGLAAWPLHLAIALLVLAELEEIAITLVLPCWQADVPSLAAALRRRGRR